MAVLLVYYYPLFLGFVFLVFFFAAKVPARWSFLLRACVALGIAVAFAHLNRTFNFWPAYRGFPSGHMTFSLGASLSLGMLRPWTLAITLPILVPFGVALVALGFHSVWDVLGAVPLVLVVYGIVHWLWKMPPPLDIGPASP